MKKDTLADQVAKELTESLKKFEIEDSYKEASYLRTILFYLIGYMSKSPKFIAGIRAAMYHANTQHNIKL